MYLSLIQCLSCSDSLLFWSQILFKGNYCQENANSKQEHRSSGRRHVLEYGVQDGDPRREGCIYYTYYTVYLSLYPASTFFDISNKYHKKWTPDTNSDIQYNMYNRYNLLGVGLRLEPHIPGHVVDQMNDVLVQNWHFLDD